MSIDGMDCRRRTEDLVDDWAHDAGIVAKDEHVKGRAGLRSSDEAWKSRNHGTVGEAAEHVVTGAAREFGPDVLEHGVSHVPALAGAAGAVGAAGVIVGTAIGANHLYSEWAHAHQKGDNLRALAQNDAVNVAIARKLDFKPAFGNDEAASRPGVEKNTEKLVSLLNGKDAALVPILQSRADEGFLAQERAFAATKHLAGTPERGPAMRQWMKDNGFEDRQRNDVAFGKGAEYFMWLEGVGARRGVDPHDESKRVHDRQPPGQSFACRG